jgi:hypothetical protein
MDRGRNVWIHQLSTGISDRIGYNRFDIRHPFDGTIIAKLKENKAEGSVDLANPVNMNNGYL